MIYVVVEWDRKAKLFLLRLRLQFLYMRIKNTKYTYDYYMCAKNHDV